MLNKVLVAAMAIAVAAGPIVAQERKPIRFGFSSVADLQNDNGATAWLFEKYVEDHSDTLDVQIYGSSEIGSDQDVIQAMQLGSGATMSIGGTALYNSFIPRVGVLDLPFRWKDYDHVSRALDGEVGAELAADFEAAGFKVLGFGYSWGYRNVVTAEVDVTKPEDIAGLKLRTIQSPIYVAALNAMGANATPMAFGEVYTALQTGVLDGFEHAASMVYSAKLYEVTNHVALTRHLFGATVMTYSLALWNQLTPEEQGVLQDGADFAIEVSRALAPGREVAALDLLREQGMTVTEIDTTSFAEAALPLQEQLAEEIGARDILDQIRDAAE
jgi:tripartite ATP-independent transporter DctP family solute receptor